MKKALLISSFIISIAIGISIILFLRSEYLANLIARKLLPQLENVIGREMTISESHINLYPLYWELKDVTLYDKETGKKFITVKDVMVYISFRDIDEKTFEITTLKLIEPIFHVVRYPDGHTNIKGMFPKKKPIGWFVLLRSVTLHNGKVIYDDLKDKKKMIFTKMYGTLQPNLLKKEIRGRMQARALYKDKRVLLRRLKVYGEGKMDIHRGGSKKISLSRLLIRSSRGTVFDAKGNITYLREIDLKGILHIPLREIVSHTSIRGRLAGRALFKGRLWGPIGHPYIKGNVKVRHIKYDHISYGDMSLEINYRPWHVDVLSLQGDILGGNIEGNGYLAISRNKKSFYLQGRGTGLYPFKIVKKYGKKITKYFHRQGKVDFSLSLKGDNFALKYISGHVNTHYKDINQDISIEGDIDRGSVEANSMGSLKDVALYFHLPRFPFHGAGSFTGSISGKIYNPDIKGEVNIPSGRVKTVPFTSTAVKLHYFNRTLDILDVKMNSKGALYTLKGQVIFNPPPEKIAYTLTGTINHASPEDMIYIFYRKLPVHTIVDGKATFSGKGKNFIFHTSLQSSKGTIFGQTFNESKMTISIDRKRITISRAYIKQGENIIEGTGWIGLSRDEEGMFSVKASSRRYNIEDMVFMRQNVPFIRGVSSFHVTGRGKFDNPYFEIWVEGSHLYIKDIDEGRFHLFISKDGSIVKIGGETSTTSFNGSILWIEDRPFNFNIKFKKTSISPYIRLLRPSILKGLSLKISGSGAIEGKLFASESYKIRIDLSDVEGAYGDYMFTNDGDIRLDYVAGILTFTSVRFKGPNTSLRVIGSMIKDGKINIFVNGEAELILLAMFTPEIRYSKGKSFLAFLISGDVANPAVRGGLVIQDGTIRSETLHQTLTKASISIFFNGREIILETLKGSLGGGTISGTGKMEIEGLDIKKFGLIMEISNALFRYPSGMVTQIDGTLVFQGTPENKSLRGEIIMKKAVYEKKIKIRSLILEIQRRRVRVEKPIPFFGNTSLNVHIEGRKNIWINNNLAQIPLTVDLILKGSIDHPLLFGRIEALDGTFVFGGNPFKVVSATADFISTDRIKPVIDIHATTDIRDNHIDLKLSGTTERFDLLLSSDPPLSETDIIALLTVGQTAAEVAETMKDIGALEATAFITAPIQEKLESALHNLMKIDRFQVEPYFSDSTSSGGARLTVGKRLLNNKLYVTYTAGITSVEELIKLEYFLSRNIYIVGERDEQGRISGDIRFRFRFK